MSIDQFTILYLGIVSSGFIIGWSIHQGSSDAMRMITSYLGAVFICELIAYILKIALRHNLLIHHITPSIYAYFMGMFFFNSIYDKALKKVIIPSFILLIIFSIINTNFIQGWNAYPTYMLNAFQMLLIFWSAMLFLEMLDKHPVHANIFRNPQFITAMAILWYGLASFLFYLLYNVFTKYDISTNLLHDTHKLSNLIFYGLLLTAIIFEKLSIHSCKKNLSVS